MSYRKQFTAPTTPSSDDEGYTLQFLANSGTVMQDNGYTVDLDTLLVPIQDGEMRNVNQLEEQDTLSVPLLLDHDMTVNSQAGIIRRLWVDGDGLHAEARLSHVPSGELVRQLALDGALTSSFSITIDTPTPPGNDKIIHDSQLVEISVVYRGADYKTAFTSINSKGEHTVETIENKLDADENKALTDAIEQATQAIQQAVDKLTDDTDKPDDKPADTKPVPPVQNSHQPQFNKANTTVTQAYTASSRTYLDSKQAMNDYANILFNSKNTDPQDIHQEWAAFARGKLGYQSYASTVSGADYLIPTGVITKIEDVLNTAGSGIWQAVNHTGMDAPITLTANMLGLDSDDGRAHGYPVSEYGNSKKQEKIQLKKRQFVTDYVYKYLPVPKGELRRTMQNPQVLLNYILQELPARLIQTMERAIVMNTDWTDLTMFKSVYADSLQTDAAAGAETIAGQRFAAQYTQASGETLLESFIAANALVTAEGDRILVTSRENAAKMKLAKGSDGQFQAPLGADYAGLIGVSKIVTPEWWNATDSKNAQGVIFVPSAYNVYGDDGIQAFTNFKLETNENQFLQEIFTGGGLAKLRSGVVVKPAAAAPAGH